MRIHTQTLTRVGVAIVATALLATGCADSGDDDDSGTKNSMSKEDLYEAGVHGEQDAGEPQDGGTLRVGEYAEARSIDPTVTYPFGAVGGSAMAAVFDTLVRYDYENQDYVPQLAESLESNKKFTTWTLKLRPDTKFTDGTTMDADAVVAAQQYYTDNYGFNTAMLLSDVKSVTATDDLTVTYELNKPWTGFASQLASGYGMIPAPAAYKGGKEGFKPIGAGPFIEESYKPGEERILVRNDDYVGEKAHLESIQFVYPASDAARLDALKNGDFDQTALRRPDMLETARNDGIAGFISPTGLGTMMWINNREGHAGSDVRIRRAMAMAIDPETYFERTQGGAGIPSRNIFTPAAPYFSEIDELQTDLDAAKKLVAEAKADGANTTIKYITPADQASKTSAVTIEGTLKSIGLDVEIEYVASITDQVLRLYATFDYDIAQSSMQMGLEDPYVPLANALLETSSTNASGYSSPEMTKLIDSLQGVAGDERTAIAKQINELWQEDMPGIPLGPSAFFFAWADNVHGIQPTGGDMLLYHTAWLS